MELGVTHPGLLGDVGDDHHGHPLVSLPGWVLGILAGLGPMGVLSAGLGVVAGYLLGGGSCVLTW